MNMDKAKTIINAAMGLKRYEWRRIAHFIDRKFDEASNRIELTQEDANRIEFMVRLDSGEEVTL